ncbi:F0F1 ATP synthase subunit gamma [Brucella intermedia]|uniref:ATP synthase gamma chain n=5 Tax=Brucella TaxID=234 RepID=U4VCD9_9HYPH|nr:MULTISPECIES: F0F1 ATP synthase subunit gamma [Brucella/Ochrobactrum group]ERM00341.1 F0F1 ATP synthase subunit gamma [Brucella intermedia 229E]KAB2668096.1 F0F1 ATP synthase subunit gamma [Ochrobactrum sp. LMG 5442]NKC27942.1 F0F1 ATP synthase subunit gamma [Brucella ciceri]PJR88314.1 F0F1 ATP synthase subunit gamma [Ochrobactrum sp. 721/2009]PJT15590.1 F0F1 ATP synthase subunit gamma [Ochrobactrum sp. 720/2009]PJT19074.1 F0F1 ATP synthase subunit gamma [Ochrobactrum sp. 715/2009]PJT2064
MPSLKDLRNRIASVKATQKITKAMQMVAAAKLRRAQEAAEAARPYSQRMGAVLANIAQNVTGEDAPALMAGTGKDDVHLLVVCTAERGLCGGFNSQIARLARDHARKLLAEGKTVKIITVGKKGADILRREFASLLVDHVDLREVKQLAFVHADQIGHKIIKLFEEGAFDVCTLFYSEFKSVISQVPTAQQLIPASAGDSAGGETAGDAIYEYEPDPAAILSTLIPRNISVQIFRALLENVAGEMGAKMSAMDNATRNAGDMINKLSITYNRQRQAQITKELIEIISGAEAL